MKKILLTCAFLSNILYANTINAISMIVDKEPITVYEIQQTMKKLNIPRNQALIILVNEKIEQAQIKKFGIAINEIDLENSIDRMLEQNRISLEQFKKELKNKNQNFEAFKQDFKKDLEKRKLYEQILTMAKIDYSEAGAKNFFEMHKSEFSIFTEIDVNIYNSNDPTILEEIKKSHKISFKRKQAHLNINNSDPRLLALLSQININDFSPVLNSKNGYELYEVKDKRGEQTPDFDEVKNEVLNVYINKQKQNFIQDYFEKLRSKVNIEYIR